MEDDDTLNTSSKIRVLLVDDEPLAIEGWKKVLGNSSQIEVVGESSPAELPLTADFETPPEIVIAGYSLMEAGLLKESLVRSMWGIHPKIILIVSNDQQLELALKTKVDKVVLQPFDDQDLINWVRGLSDHAKRLCADYKLQLKKSSAKKTNQYCNLVSDILEFLFHPDLVNPSPVMKGSHAVGSRRLMFRNQAKDHQFWIGAKDTYAANYIAVDIHDRDLDAENINALANFLSSPHGKLGLVIGRSLSSVLRTIPASIYSNTQKVILVITDAHLHDMLAYKAGGVNPVCFFQDLYQDLIASALYTD